MPTASPHDAILDRIADVPYALLEYDRWLRATTAARTGPRDYLFSADAPRFEPRKDDVVTVLPGLRIQEHRGASALALPGQPGRVELPGVSRKVAERILAAIDGERCLAEIRWAAEVDAGDLARLLRATFGLVIFAPKAVAALERAVPSVEIVRFPSSPYGVERPYWVNMAAVRERFLHDWPAAASSHDLVRLLRRLHVLAVMGPGLDSFYKPASPGSDLRVNPGALLLDPPRVLPTRDGHVFLDGPRVNASPVGGEPWHRLVARAAGANAPSGPEATFDDGGLPWGRIVLARAEHEDRARPWFCPPRPWKDEHTDSLYEQLKGASSAAEEGRRDDAIAGLARFHQAFIRLHPFHCANQCLAMSIVNALLTRLAGAGMPHLLLDHLALRLPTSAYERVFQAAVRAFLLADDDPARRLAILRDRRTRSFALIDRLAACRTEQQEREAMAQDPEAAAWALVAPSP